MGIRTRIKTRIFPQKSEESSIMAENRKKGYIYPGRGVKIDSRASSSPHIGQYRAVLQE